MMDDRTNESTEHLCDSTPSIGFKSVLDTSSRTPSLLKDSNRNNEQPTDEDTYSTGFNFENKNIRRNFCLKVFLIISMQFAVTSIITSWFMFDPAVANFNRRNPSLLIIIAVISIMNLIILGFCGELRRLFPVNYAFLFTVTMSKAFLLATITTYCNYLIIVLIVVLISVTMLVLSFAAVTYSKLNFLIGFIGCLLFIFVCSCFICAFKLVDVILMLYASISALIISAYFLYEVLAMVRGNHTFNITPHECIFAALCTYIDVPNVLFGVCFICIKYDEK